MKWFIAWFLPFCMLFSSAEAPVSTPSSARNYIVYDPNSSEILEGKDYEDVYSVASISKIMTAVLALESTSLFEIVTVGDIIYSIEGSSLYLEVGDRITLIDLVYGLLLRSGNDAAVLIAETVSGSVEKFVESMNAKAAEIGMEDTVFHNPSGLDIFDEGNLSTCLDMARLMAYCLGNELFREIVATKNYRSPLKGNWANKNKLLQTYEYCIGGKTGYTRKARRTLVTAGEKDGQELIVVTFSCGNDFEVHRNLYEHYFNDFTYLVFLEKGENRIDDYCIYSEKVVGMRLDKAVKKGVKIYYLNPILNRLTIRFVDEKGVEYTLNAEFEIFYTGS